jgi:MoaA/NifB/PqqE/SkfB family radical SAM enzyme
LSNKKRLTVHLYVTPLCNLECKHCYYDAKSEQLVQERLLTINEMRSIIANLSDTYSAAFDVEGGEFFLRDDIDKLFEVVQEHYWKNITITTNGTVSIGIKPKHLRCLDEFRISVEGHTDELHQEVRGISLAPVLKNCLLLHSNGVPITLRITLHKKNFAYLFEMIEHFVKLGFTKFSLYEFQQVGRGSKHRDEYCLNQSEIEKIFNLLISKSLVGDIEIFKLSLNRGRVSVVNSYREKLVHQGYNVIDLSGIPSLTINYNGEIGVCPWNIGNDVIGVFREESFNTDIARYMENGLLAHSCNHCSAIRVLYQSKNKGVVL